jgi:hypothetical protein
MSILSEISRLNYQKLEALCDFSKVLKKAIKAAIKKAKHQFEAERSVLEYWDKEADGSITYGSFFPKAAGDTEIKYWAGLHWTKNKSDDTIPIPYRIIFYVYIPVNMLFMCPKIASQLKNGAINSQYYDIYPCAEYTVVLKDQFMNMLNCHNTTAPVTINILTKFITEVLKDLENTL